MKVLMLNASPHKEGCTYTALCEVAKGLEEYGIESEIYTPPNGAVSGCMACGACRELGKCVINDCVNEFTEKAKDADGFVFGSPVHYAGASGVATSLLDRAFYSGSKYFAFKPGASIVSCRRGGASAAFDQLNKYFTISNMIVVGSSYWNQVHGSNAEEVVCDLEGMQTMRQLGRNMGWVIKSLNMAKDNNLPHPDVESQFKTNFIR